MNQVQALKVPAIVFAWVSVLIASSTLVLLVTSGFFDWPLRLRAQIEPGDLIDLTRITVSGQFDQVGNLTIQVSNIPVVRPVALKAVFRKSANGEPLVGPVDLRPRATEYTELISAEQVSDPMPSSIFCEFQLYENGRLVKRTTKEVSIKEK